ncbi:putative short-chain dehydrogenase/reductase [Zopfia rhizophila CBS 207.26]|uniref:Putative short-chain dehydrogenase/reductase n=1 Tax=Zopfia rhizophila CBS 207.26 TaxID=1314779 RepID=A0A6A6ETI9_9PEZI|nr:putative short-chain dehydrogenase/reductase [Zopfia rhizophila CBS 207.26]
MVQKSVLITGSSEGGIGDALAKAFHRKGLRVFATARDLAKVQHLKDMGLNIVQLDVANNALIKQAVETVKAATGGTLDILVNNSGGGYSVPLLDSDVSVAKKMFDVNVFGLVAVTQAFAPLLTALKGTIVNIGSVLGHAPFPWSGYYNASKAVANLLTDQMRIELSPWGVKAILVVTGVVKTKFFDNLPDTPCLPHTSLYYDAKDEIEPVMAGAEIEKDGIDVDIYAEAVVSNALKSNPKKHQWVGGSAFTIWSVSTFGWSTIWDLLLPSLVKLLTVIKKIYAARKLE